jgi:hypothetical protein
LPFLRPNNSGSTGNVSHNQAALGTVNAAHAIIHASRVLHALCKQPPGARSKRPGPAIFDYYSFGQALFEAAVVCAHSVIVQPTAIWAKVALDDIVGALEVMRDPVVATGRGSVHGGVEGSVSEPVKVVELLKKKADTIRAGNGSSAGSGSGSKRKHAEVESEADHLLAGFQLPYVGAAVASTGPGVGSPNSAPLSSPTDGTHSTRSRPGTPHNGVPSNGSEGVAAKRTDSEKVKSKKEKKAPYPMVGIRVRPGKEIPSLARQRERAHSTVSTSSLTESDTRIHAPSPLTPSQVTPMSTNRSFAIPAPQESSSMYQPPPAVDSMQPPPQPDVTPNTHSDYSSSSFASSDNSGIHSNLTSSRPKFAIHEISPQQGYSTGTLNPMAIFDQSQSNSFATASSPVSFRSGSSDQSPVSFGGGSVGYFAPNTYPTNFDNSSSQGSLLDLSLTPSLDNTSGMNGSLTTSSNDMMFEVKSQNGIGLQQSFGHRQGWQQDGGGNGNSAQFWQPDYKPYFSA